MQATELLISAGVAGFIAQMDDGTYRWTTATLDLLDGGPAREWVEARRVAKTTGACPNIRRPLAHDLLLRTLNANNRADTPTTNPPKSEPT